MATKQVYISDISGKEIDSDSPTVVFGWKGKRYEIDLLLPEQKAFEAAISQYLEAAREVQESPRYTYQEPTAPRRGRPRKDTTDGTIDRRTIPQSTGVEEYDNMDKEDRKIVLEDLRTWARENAIPVADRGRIKAEIVQQYYAHRRGKDEEASTEEKETAKQ